MTGTILASAGAAAGVASLAGEATVGVGADGANDAGAAGTTGACAAGVTVDALAPPEENRRGSEVAGTAGRGMSTPATPATPAKAFGTVTAAADTAGTASAGASGATGTGSVICGAVTGGSSLGFFLKKLNIVDLWEASTRCRSQDRRESVRPPARGGQGNRQTRLQSTPF